MLNETVGIVIPYQNNTNTLPAVLAGLSQSNICLHIYVVDDESLTAAVDYDMMRRTQQFYCLANIPDILLDYMIRSNSISVNKRLMQTFNRLRIQLRYFTWGNIHVYTGIVRTLIALLLRAQWLNRFKKWRIERATSLRSLIGIG